MFLEETINYAYTEINPIYTLTHTYKEQSKVIRGTKLKKGPTLQPHKSTMCIDFPLSKRIMQNMIINVSIVLHI